MTFQCQRLSQCPLGKLYVITHDGYCASVQRHTPTHVFARFSHKFTSHMLFSLSLFFFEGILTLWNWANHQLPVIDLALFVWRWWMFLWEEWGQVLLLSLEPISGKARGQHYISSAVRHNSYSKTAATSIWRFYSRTTFTDILNLIWKHLLQSWHRFYLTVWGTTTMSTSSKYLGTWPKFWINCSFLLLFGNLFRAYI